MPTGLAAADLASAGVYRPRRPLASPLHRLLSDHFERFRGRYEDMFEHRYGRWRWVVDAVVERFLACGVLEAGFARVRCEDCKAEYLLAFSCKMRYFCPSCHAKRLAEWTPWLGDGGGADGRRGGREGRRGLDGRPEGPSSGLGRV